MAKAIGTLLSIILFIVLIVWAKPTVKWGLQVESFNAYCRSRLMDIRDDVVATGDTRLWIINVTEYLDQCVEKRR